MANGTDDTKLSDLYKLRQQQEQELDQEIALLQVRLKTANEESLKLKTLFADNINKHSQQKIKLTVLKNGINAEMVKVRNTNNAEKQVQEETAAFEQSCADKILKHELWFEKWAKDTTENSEKLMDAPAKFRPQSLQNEISDLEKSINIAQLTEAQNNKKITELNSKLAGYKSDENGELFLRSAAAKVVYNHFEVESKRGKELDEEISQKSKLLEDLERKTENFCQPPDNFDMCSN